MSVIYIIIGTWGRGGLGVSVFMCLGGRGGLGVWGFGGFFRGLEVWGFGGLGV